MSKYEWEKGTIKIPANQYKAVRDTVMRAHNRRVESHFDLANGIYEALKVALKGTRNIDWYSAQFDRWYRDKNVPAIRRNKLILLDNSGDDYDGELSWKLQNVLFPYKKGTDVRVKRPQKPKKKDFAPASSSTKRYEASDGTILFDNQKRTVTWIVSENNHAIDHAREHPLARALFGALERVVWTSRTGGTIIGNDEYNRDTDYEGGGGNYVTMRFGADKKKYEDQFKTKRHRAWR